MGSLMVARSQAKSLFATLTASGGLLDTFTIESDGGVQLPGDPDAIFFTITKDTSGFTAVTFRDLNDSAFGAFGNWDVPGGLQSAIRRHFSPANL